MLLRVTAALSPVDQALLQAFAVEQAVTVFIQQEEKSSAQYAFGKEQVLLQHEKSKTALACMPGDFLQANGAVNALLIDAVLSAMDLRKTDLVLEAFSGLGNFTLPIAKAVKQVSALEVSETMVSRAKAQAIACAVTNVSWLVCDLSNKKNIEKVTLTANKILLDPPREGAVELVKSIGENGPRRIVYVSCNPATLARDSDVLLQAGYTIQRLAMLDMFPHTGHLESMVLFEHKNHSNRSEAASSEAGD